VWEVPDVATGPGPDAEHMKALIVHESMYGNTHAVADAVAEGLAEGLGAQAEIDPCPVHAMPTVPADLDLLIVGGPTHLHGLSTAPEPRHGGGRCQGGRRQGRAWRDRGARPARVAARPRRAARGPRGGVRHARRCARGAHRLGFDVVDRNSFLVADAEGPLEDGERARAWGEALASDHRQP
jgi:hypothetical protein